MLDEGNFTTYKSLHNVMATHLTNLKQVLANMAQLSWWNSPYFLVDLLLLVVLP